MESNTNSNISPETYVFENDAVVVALISKLADAACVPEDEFDAFEAEMHVLLNAYGRKK